MLWFVNPSAPKRRRASAPRSRKVPTVYDCRKPGCPTMSDTDALVWLAKRDPGALSRRGRSRTYMAETPLRATGRRVSQAVRGVAAKASEKARSWVKKRKRMRKNPFTQESFAKAKTAYAARGKTARQRAALAGAFTRRVKKGLKKTMARQDVTGPRRDAKGQFRKAPGGPRVAASAVPLMESLLAPVSKRKTTKARPKKAKARPTRAVFRLSRKPRSRSASIGAALAALMGRQMRDTVGQIKGASAMAKKRKRRAGTRRPRRDSQGRFLSKRSVGTKTRKRRKYRRNPSAAVMAAVVKQTKSRRRRRFKGQGQARYFLKKWQTRPGRKIKRKSIRRLAAGHRRVLWYKAYGSAAARRYIRRHRLNPARRRSGGGGKLGTTIKQVLLTAAPLVGAFYVSRLIATKVAGVGALAAVTSKLGRHTKPLLSAAVLGAAFFGTKKLPKYRMPALLGAALNFVDVAFREYAPAPIQAFLGTGDSQVYDEALLGAGDYVQPQGSLGDYMQTGAYEEIGDYFQGQGQFEEVGGVRPMDVMPATRQIQPWAAEPDEAFYTGVFSGGFGS